MLVFRRHAWFVYPACLLLFVAPGTGRAAEDDQGPIATSVAEAGRAWWFQGEYAGRVKCGYRTAPLGLQVIALGGRNLGAVQFPGGLPGAGWDCVTRQSADGTWSGEVASLAGPDCQFMIHREKVYVYDGDGVFRGWIYKVQRSSPTEGLLPPPGAIVLFDGTATGELNGVRITADGLLMEGTETVRPVRDFHLHIEFRTPFMPEARGQGRGNSGVYLQGRYEVQILDSFGLSGEPNECGGIYKLIPPRVNMCFPPLVWQTYDIDFRAARFDTAGRKLKNACITVVQNGVPVHRNQEIPSKTGAGKPEGFEPLPIKFQDHHDPVRFRNIWMIERWSREPEIYGDSGVAAD
ncbi:MAG: DUF1080 domain-containing protein [Pirellulales bacterium]|nr:DUF1080 domain-containing protein [Pirellulales bacterium]